MSSHRESELQDVGYRFPYGRATVEPVPDHSGTFAVRLAWHKGKADLPLLESTPLRPIAEVTLGDQKFPVFLSQHGRKKRDRIMLAGKRKTSRSARCTLRFIVTVEGREDRLTWHWRIGATAPAMEAAQASCNVSNKDAPSLTDAVRLYFPFAPGKARVLTLGGSPDAVALWMHDIVVTIVTTQEAEGVQEGYSTRPELVYDEKGAALVLCGAALGGKGVTLSWETWLAPARTEVEARQALLRHIADVRDRAQIPGPVAGREAGLLLRLAENAEQRLMAEDLVAKRGLDRQVFRLRPGDTTQVVGEGVDAALAACTLLARHYLSGDDALKRRARLVSKGVCDFQVSDEESPNWGAIWDTQRKKIFGDLNGETTLSITTAARTVKGLWITHTAFGHDVIERCALSAAQWLLLKMDRDGFIASDRFHHDGPPIDALESPWTMCEAITPLVETFRRTKNEIFLKTAMRVIKTLGEALSEARLPLERASTEHLAAAIEGVLLVSREYEQQEMIVLAQRLGVALRTRRAPDGSFTEPPGLTSASPLSGTIAGARAALALARVDDSPQWPLLAFRALRAAGKTADEMQARGEWVNLSDLTALCAHSMGLLVTAAARTTGSTADRDLLTIARGWQTFAPDPATKSFIQVYPADSEGWPLLESKVDYIALVCPITLQVLIAVLATPDMEQVRIIKNGRMPFVKNLISGELDLMARLEPLGDGSELKIGLFLADT